MIKTSKYLLFLVEKPENSPKIRYKEHFFGQKPQLF